ncbi:receptor protein kinase clavata1 [Quercus suber]|uniref:Receptor protein kinase clavata1 n=1 Tax=Quercus suber TaxID=58331 RepID=A0AAW0IVZ9_QUESU
MPQRAQKPISHKLDVLAHQVTVHPNPRAGQRVTHKLPLYIHHVTDEPLHALLAWLLAQENVEQAREIAVKTFVSRDQLVGEACPTTHSSDYEVLLKLKSSMMGPQVSGLEDWKHYLSPTTHCSFSRVSCDHDSRLISLNVSNIPLFSFIPLEIGLLNKLVNLTLAADNLTGMLLMEMANLTPLKLEILDTCNNNFSGPLPTELVNLKNLKHLCLGGNYFSGPIPDSYSEIQSLEFLDLNGNSLTGKIPARLGRLKNLKGLFVGYYNAFEGGIPEELGSLSSLQRLDMANCSLIGEIPRSLSLLKNLEALLLQINRLTGRIWAGHNCEFGDV